MGAVPSSTLILVMMAVLQHHRSGAWQEEDNSRIEEALRIIHGIAVGDMGTLCISSSYKLLPTSIDTTSYDSVRQKADMAALLLEEVGVANHSGVVEAVSRSLVASDPQVVESRVVGVNSTTGLVVTSAVWRRSGVSIHRAASELPQNLEIHQETPWYPAYYPEEKFTSNPEPHLALAGWWTYPYYSCRATTWLISYTVPVLTPSNYLIKGFLSFDIDISKLEINQCDQIQNKNQIKAFEGSHKCHNTTECVFQRGKQSWLRGSYACVCKDSYFMVQGNPPQFDGYTLEATWQENNGSSQEMFRCSKCEPGCGTCVDSTPCLATYNWPFRLTLLTVSAICVLMTLCLIAFVYHHRRLKVFKVASPIFLSITLLGCAIMYAEMAAIFPILDVYSCIATKWSRHLGFCITYTALLMKTWRVSLTYRVKSAHKVKLTDKQLLQWMFPILLVMLIYLGTWTLSDPPVGQEIKDNNSLIFKQCSFNWWDHSIAIGEVLFLAWGIRVCYSVRHAESLFNEARLISYAIYNIAIVNIAMVAFHLFLFPRAGPDIKYMLGFIRTQLSTSVTIALVFGPKVVRVVRGQGDQWDTKARTRAVTASFSLNGVGLVTEHTPDLYQENEELKEEIQKLAGQIEFMRIVNMELNNRHIKPKPGGYFSGGVQSPRSTAAPASTDLSERV